MKKKRVYLLPNLDGENQAMIAASNEPCARAMMGNVSLGSFKAYGGKRVPADWDVEAQALALASPGTVFYRRIPCTLAKGIQNDWRPKKYSRHR